MSPSIIIFILELYNTYIPDPYHNIFGRNIPERIIVMILIVTVYFIVFMRMKRHLNHLYWRIENFLEPLHSNGVHYEKDTEETNNAIYQMGYNLLPMLVILISNDVVTLIVATVITHLYVINRMRRNTEYYPNGITNLIGIYYRKGQNGETYIIIRKGEGSKPKGEYKIRACNMDIIIVKEG